MKVEGTVVPISVLHKVKVKEEAKECCGFQQSLGTSTSPPVTTVTASSSPTIVSPISIASTISTSTASTTVNTTNNFNETSIIATTINPTTSATAVSLAFGSNIANPDVTSPSSRTTPQPSSVICQASAATSSLVTMVNKSSEHFPVDLDLKTKVPQGMFYMRFIYLQFILFFN